MDRDGALLGTLRELLEQLLPPNEPDAPPADEPREEEDTPPPREENAASDTDSVPDLASASSSSDSDEGPPPARRRPRMPALAPASSSDSESDGEAPELASASSSDDEAETPPRRAAAGPRVVRVGRHVLVVGGGPGEGRPDLGDRPARVRTALALIRHVMLASRGSDTYQDMADTLARDGAARSPHVVAAFRAVDRAQFLPADARADAYIDSPARSGAFHQSSPSIYAAALEALDLGGGRRRSFLNIGSGTGYFSALCATAAAHAGGELSPHVGIERHAELTTWARARTTDVFYDVGDVYDVVAALHEAGSPLRGRFDRVYVGAGVDRSACRVLLRLLAPDGVLVAPRDDRRGEAQRLVTAVRRGAGDAYAVTAGARVAFASLVHPSGGGTAACAPALAGPVWSGAESTFEAFKLESFQLTGRCHTGLGRGQARRLPAGVSRRRRHARARRGAGRRRRGECAVARVAREDPAVRPGALVRARARRRRRPARVRSVRPARAREVLVRPRHVLLARLPARGFRRARCCLHGAARRRPRRCRRVGRRGRAWSALEAAPGCRSRGRGGRRGRGGWTGTGR